jgi:hypothetical protein
MGEEALTYILLDYENSHYLLDLFTTAELLTLSMVWLSDLTLTLTLNPNPKP